MSHIKASISHIRQITPSVIELTLVRADGRSWPGRQPGQYATLSFPHIRELKGARSFSIANTPTDLRHWQFGIRVHGQFTKALQRLQIGEPAEVTGPFGQFTFNSERDNSALFIAGGIGVTPFLSMIQSATAQRLPNDLVLLYCVRSLADAPYIAEVEKLAQANPKFHPFYAVSDGRIPQNSERMFNGRLTSVMVAQAVNGQVWNRSYFLCGPPPFMKSAKNALQSLGVAPEEAMTERFSAGSSEIFERGTNIPKYLLASWGLAAVIVLGAIVHLEQGKRDAATDTQTVNNAPVVQTNTNRANRNTNQSTPTQRVAPTNTNTTQPSRPSRVVPRTTVS